MGTSKHQLIQAALIRALHTEQWPSGARIPSGRTLAQEMGCTLMTMERALRELVLQGYLLRKPRRGTFVAPQSCWGQALTQSATAFIGVIHGFQEGILPAMNAELAARGYGMVVRHVGDDLAVALHALRELVQHGVRGIIWSPLSTPQYQADNLQLTQAIMDSGLPAVAVDRYPEEIEVNSVVSDNAHAGYLLTKYLLERGHRRIGLLRHSYGSTPADRHRGYLRALREYGVTPAEPWVMYVDHQLPRTELVAYLRDWLRTVPLTAVWSIAGNPLGMAVLAAAQAEGLRVPDDLSVATFDEIIAPFPVTAIMQPLTAIGQRAAALLCDAIEHPSPEIQRIILRSRLVEGSSCLPLSPVPSHETIRVAGSA